MATPEGWPSYSHSSPGAGVHGPCPGCADLQHQLRQAQEVRDRLIASEASANRRYARLWDSSKSILKRCRAERDAAIERGVQVYREGQLFLEWGISRFTMARGLLERAEAAEEKLVHLEGKASDNDCPYLADKIRVEQVLGEMLAEAQEERDCDGRSGQRCDNDEPCLFHARIFLKAAERDAAEKGALAGRFAARCREIAAKDCGYWSEEYHDDEGVALLAEADRLPPAEALRAEQQQGGQEEKE